MAPMTETMGASVKLCVGGFQFVGRRIEGGIQGARQREALDRRVVPNPLRLARNVRAIFAKLIEPLPFPIERIADREDLVLGEFDGVEGV